MTRYNDASEDHIDYEHEELVDKQTNKSISLGDIRGDSARSRCNTCSSIRNEKPSNKVLDIGEYMHNNGSNFDLEGCNKHHFNDKLTESSKIGTGFKRTIKWTTKREWLSCREILWYLVFTGGAINYMLKISLNFVIVAMVIPRTEQPSSLAECNVVGSLNSNATFHSYESLNKTSAVRPSNEYAGKFNWTEYEQGLALGAFYWSYWSTQVPGGLFAQKYGTKLVFGGANFLAALLALLIPSAIKWHLNAFLFLRILQGAIMGVVTPSMNIMTAKWIPPNERSKFVSAYMGGSVGTAITYPLCALVIRYLNWEAAFYVTSGICIIWYCFWIIFMFDSPQQHPRITEKELDYILVNTPASLTASKKRSIPWKSILTSRPMWVTTLAHWGATWGFYTLLAQGATYFRFIHGWDLSATGLIAGAPHILLMGFSYGFGWLSDWLLKSGKMTLTGVRKFAITMCTGVQAAFTVGLSLSGCQSTLAVFFMLMGTMVTGGISAGTVANFVDLSPNFGSILLGICGLAVNGVGAISPLIVGLLTNDNQTIGQWRLVFLISAANMIFGFIVYMIWGTATEQPWNLSIDDVENSESMHLNGKDDQLFKTMKTEEMTQEKKKKKEKKLRI